MASGAVGNRASAPVAQPDWMDYAGAGHRIGSLNARVTVIEFFDYQCPFCKKMDARLQSALAKYSGDLAVVYRHWPLKRIHPFAMAAAVASECAAASGRFERMHALLLNQQDSLGVLSWRELGARAGVQNLDAYSRCLSDTTASNAIARDTQAAERLGARGTPVLLMNGLRYGGTISEAVLDSAVEAALKASISK